MCEAIQLVRALPPAGEHVQPQSLAFQFIKLNNNNNITPDQSESKNPQAVNFNKVVRASFTSLPRTTTH